MQKTIFQKVKEELAEKPNQLTDTDMWLFVTVNTARALIGSVNKGDLSSMVFDDCKSIAEIQRNFDMIQGIYGKNSIKSEILFITIYVHLLRSILTRNLPKVTIN